MMLSLLAKRSRRRFSAAASPVLPVFKSDFDGECKLFIESLLDPFPLQLKKSEQYGMGLYANRNISRGELLLQEKSLLSTIIENDPRAAIVAAHSPHFAWKDDYYLVASGVSSAMNSGKWPIPPRSHLPLRCLGYFPIKTFDHEVVRNHLFSTITEVFGLRDLPRSIWNATECVTLYDKIKSNCFMSDRSSCDVFCAASMLNHSCVPNAVFSSFDSLISVQDIPVGEQVFVSYNVMDPTVDLPEFYGFKCSCPRCKAQG